MKYVNSSNLQIQDNYPVRNAVTSRKVLKSAKGSRQYSQSDRKRQSMSNLESDSVSYLQTSNLRARKNLSSEFGSYSHTNTDLYTKSNRDSYSRSKSGSYSNRDSKSYDETDAGNSVPGYSLRTVRTIVTEEFEDFDEGLEKGEQELSEKNATSVSQLKKSESKTVDHLYGKNLRILTHLCWIDFCLKSLAQSISNIRGVWLVFTITLFYRNSVFNANS